MSKKKWAAIIGGTVVGGFLALVFITISSMTTEDGLILTFNDGYVEAKRTEDKYEIRATLLAMGYWKEAPRFGCESPWKFNDRYVAGYTDGAVGNTGSLFIVPWELLDVGAEAAIYCDWDDGMIKAKVLGDPRSYMQDQVSGVIREAGALQP